MIRIVADASVAIKWLLPTTHEEQDWENALGLLQGVRSEAVFAMAICGRPVNASSGSPRRIHARCR